MSWTLSSASVVSGLSAVLAVAIAVSVYRRLHPGRLWLTLLLLAVAEWELLRALEAAAIPMATKVTCAKLEYLGIAAVPPLWFLFTRASSGRKHVLSHHVGAALWLVPVLTVGLVVTNERHGLIWSRITRSATTPGAPLVYHHGAAFWLAAGYNYVLVLGGSLLLLWSLARCPRVYRGQIAVFVTAALLPLLANVLYLFGRHPFGGLDPTPFGFTLSGLLLGASVLRGRVLDLVPIARETVLANLLDGVVVLDPSGVIVDANPSAQRLLGWASDPLPGRHVRTILAQAPAILALLDRATAGSEEMRAPGAAEVLLEVRAVALPTAAHDRGGTVLLLRDITAQRQAEETQRAGAEGFRAVFEQAAVGMALETLEGRFQRVNDRLCTLLGYTREELMARGWQDVTAAADQERDLAAVERLVATPGQVYAADKRYVRRDGSIVWGHLTLSVQRDAAGAPLSFLAVVEDCTARVQAETAAQSAATRYRAMFETNRAIKLVVDAASGRILEANAAACAFYGYSHAALTALPIAAINVLPAAHVHAAMDAAAREERLSFIAPHRLASGEIREVEVYSGPVDMDGHTVLYSIIHDVTERTRAEAALQHQALHDALTGLPNRSLLQQQLTQALTEASAQRPLALLLLDLDRFKEINDTFGHQYGDALLREVAHRLGAAVRTSDLVTRLGGDEFAVLLPDTDEQGAIGVAGTLSGALDAAFAVAGQTLHVGSSIGVALAPGHGTDSHTLLQCADVAMYAAKRTHRGYAVYDAAQASASAQEVTLVSDLRQAIAQGALTLVYQPKVDLQSGQVCGVEALVRWPHPTHGLIPPARFIPLAEQTGLITPLTLWVLEVALAQCQRWRRAGQEVGVAVNLSMETLHEPHLLDAITQRLTAGAAPPQLLTLELTESALMTDAARALDVLRSLRSLGVRVAVDDFGTGYSSLAYLKRLPVDDLKIDGSFVRELAQEATDRAIVTAMVGLAHSLGLAVVAEGVEDAATAAALRALGCDQIQGYYLARPMPAEEVLPWMRERAGRPEYRASA